MLTRSSLSRIIYYSRSNLEREPGLLREQEQQLIRQCRRQNEFALITSILVHDRGYFCQMMEGDREALNQTFRKISSDNRHKDVRIVEWREIPRRELLPSFELIERNLMTQEILERFDIDGELARGTPKPSHLHDCFHALQANLLAKRGIEALT